MAKQPPAPTYQPANLSADQIMRAIPRLEKRIADLEKLDFSQMRERGGAEIQGIKVSIEQTLEEIFGAYSTEYRRYSPAAVLDGGPISFGRGSHQTTEFRQYYEKSRLKSVSLLKQAIQGLEERKADIGGIIPAAEVSPTSGMCKNYPAGFLSFMVETARGCCALSSKVRFGASHTPRAAQ